MAVFASAQNGLKPWVRESYYHGTTITTIEYTLTASDAKFMRPRMQMERVSVRRATVKDVAEYGPSIRARCCEA